MHISSNDIGHNNSTTANSHKNMLACVTTEKFILLLTFIHASDGCLDIHSYMHICDYV